MMKLLLCGRNEFLEYEYDKVIAWRPAYCIMQMELLLVFAVELLVFLFCCVAELSELLLLLCVAELSEFLLLPLEFESKLRVCMLTSCSCSFTTKLKFSLICRFWVDNSSLNLKKTHVIYERNQSTTEPLYILYTVHLQCHWPTLT